MWSHLSKIYFAVLGRPDTADGSYWQCFNFTQLTCKLRWADLTWFPYGVCFTRYTDSEPAMAHLRYMYANWTYWLYLLIQHENQVWLCLSQMLCSLKFSCKVQLEGDVNHVMFFFTVVLQEEQSILLQNSV